MLNLLSLTSCRSLPIRIEGNIVQSSLGYINTNISQHRCKIFYFHRIIFSPLVVYSILEENTEPRLPGDVLRIEVTTKLPHAEVLQLVDYKSPIFNILWDSDFKWSKLKLDHGKQIRETPSIADCFIDKPIGISWKLLYSPIFVLRYHGIHYFLQGCGR